jgi:hypothetical protein
MQSTLEDLVTEFTMMRIGKTPEIVDDYFVIRITKCEHHHANNNETLEIVYDAKMKEKARFGSIRAGTMRLH